MTEIKAMYYMLNFMSPAIRSMVDTCMSYFSMEMLNMYHIEFSSFKLFLFPYSFIWLMDSDFSLSCQELSSRRALCEFYSEDFSQHSISESRTWYNFQRLIPKD